MTDNKLNKDDRRTALVKYRDLVLATLDYYIENIVMQIKTTDFDVTKYYKELKTQTEEHYQKGRLARLKQVFRDLTEMQVQTGDLKFSKYLQAKTSYNIDIFKSYFKRVDKVIEKGKITTDNQFYDINMMVDQLCQTEPVDSKKIEILNRLLAEYEERKSRQTKKPFA